MRGKEISAEPILVSVVIPAFKQAEFLGDAIRSVLSQTYPHLEIIIVDDASPDNASEVVSGFDDPRVKLITHRQNLGLSAARNTGILASTGEIIALLDADDIFHPEKLQMHMAFLRDHQEFGVTYNARFELNHSDTTIRWLFRPPTTATLIDLVKGFPFSPSDMVVRREWFSKVGLFDPGAGSAEDTDLPCRLALAGCKFASVDRALNYRRYHSGRGRRNLRGRLNDVSRVLEAVFNDPRCPKDVLAIRTTAIKYHLMAVMSLALIQEETELGRELVLELIRIDPSVLEGYPCELLDYLLSEAIADEKMDHEVLLRKIFAQLPKEAASISASLDRVAARGYLAKGIRAVIWGRLEAGKAHFERASRLKAGVGNDMLQSITSNLLSYQMEFGVEATLKVIERLSHFLDSPGNYKRGRRLIGSYRVNCAFQDYRSGRYPRVPGQVLQALAKDPSYFANRGVMAILIRSLSRILRGKVFV
jgi:glycosyltransferase involved in cell wall biosynthesis